MTEFNHSFMVKAECDVDRLVISELGW